MKNLIFINGTMGVGKTAACMELKKMLPDCVFLDGDWCWDADPFKVTDETKAMVLDNIAFLLGSFLECTEYENVLFCWVMHEEQIVQDLLSKLKKRRFELRRYSLVCGAEELTRRLTKDIELGVRQSDVLERSLARLGNYAHMQGFVRIETEKMSAEQTALLIFSKLYE